MKRFATVFVLIGLTAPVLAQPLPKADEILKRVTARLEVLCADSTTNCFSYSRTNVIEEVDARGNVKKRTEKIYDVTLFQGLPRARLIALDGRQLPESEQRWRGSEERRLQRTFTQDKAPDYQKPRPWLNDDILNRFKFMVTGRTNQAGRAVLVLTFAGRTDAPVRNMADRIVNKVSGTVWVDEEEAEIARMHLTMSEPVKFWGGILGQLDKFDYVLERTRSPLGAWFNRSSRGMVHLRKLLATSRFRAIEESGELGRSPAS